MGLGGMEEGVGRGVRVVLWVRGVGVLMTALLNSVCAGERGGGEGEWGWTLRRRGSEGQKIGRAHV